MTEEKLVALAGLSIISPMFTHLLMDKYYDFAAVLGGLMLFLLIYLVTTAKIAQIVWAIVILITVVSFVVWYNYNPQPDAIHSVLWQA